MGTYYLNVNDINKINRLIKLSKSIDLLYNKLYELEINKHKESEEYKKQLLFLNFCLDLEKKLYTNLNFDEEKMSATIIYLSRFEFHKNYIDEEECLLNQDYKNISVLRVIRKLLERLESSEKGFKQVYLNNEDEIIKNNLKLAQKQTKILKEVSKDIYNSYLIFLNEYLKDKNNSLYKKDFIKSKYIFSFIYNNIEEQMIKNNFEINEDLYLGSKFLSDIFSVDIDMYNFMKDTYSKKMLDTYIEKLLKLRDLDYNNKNNYICAIFNCCYIRSCLLNMSEEAINEVDNELKNFIRSDDYKNNYAKEKISRNLVIDCFEKTKHDKSKAKILSLKIR